MISDKDVGISEAHLLSAENKSECRHAVLLAADLLTTERL